MVNAYRIVSELWAQALASMQYASKIIEASIIFVCIAYIRAKHVSGADRAEN